MFTTPAIVRGLFALAVVCASLAVLPPAAPAAPKRPQQKPAARSEARLPLPDASWRLVGPFRAGWATTVAGVEQQPGTYYFGGAGGGVWKTTNAGQTWSGLMQHERSSAIGALAVAPSDPRILYAGTGQPDARYDITAGDGVYRSSDGGETWVHMGLADSRHIGAILIDAHDPDRVLV